MATFVVLLPARLESETFKSVFYHRLQGSFWAQLADDSGPSPTPRELAIRSVDDNFKAIRALGANTVNVSLPDSDGWTSQHGGGFSYDPRNASAARPEFAVAQEIVLRIADANHLKVIFAVGLSEYRRSSDGRRAWAGMADEYDSSSKPKGAYDYLHCLIDPTRFYGKLATTKLATVGLVDGPVGSHIGDGRILGWSLSGEWNVSVFNKDAKTHPHEHTFKKYWNYFYELVHYQGANTAFAGTYLIGQPAGKNVQVANIKAFKQWFAPGSGIHEPDLIGIEYYGYQGYDLASIYSDLNEMVDAMEKADTKQYPHDFAVAGERIFLGEGSTNQTASPAINQFYQDVFQVLADRDLAGIQVWVSETLGEAQDAEKQPTLSPVASVYDLFTTSYTRAGVRSYAALPTGIAWHMNPSKGGSYADPESYGSSTDNRAAAYGEWRYTGLTSKGHWVEEAMANHTGDLNLRFYANPNPVAEAGTGESTTLYWDVSRMPEVKRVQVHAGSASGALIGNGDAKGSLKTSFTLSKNAVFVLVDVTTGKDRVLSRVTMEKQ